MKQKIRNTKVILLILLLTSCYEEEKIISKLAEVDILRYEFPQGDNAWDQDVVAIQEKFGVYLIYKNFKHEDFNRSWTGSSIGYEYRGEDLTDEQAEKCIAFMKNQIFAHLNPEILDRVLPDYWYLVYDYHQYIAFGSLQLKHGIRFYDRGLDFWAICLFYGEPCSLGGAYIPTPETPEDFRKCRCNVLGNILYAAFLVGNITYPIGLTDGIDYETPVLYKVEDKDEENYYMKRGFPSMIDSGFNYSPSYNSPLPLTMDEHFRFLIYNIIGYTKAEFDVMYDPVKYPLLHEKRQLVVNHFRDNYQIDLEKIADLQEGW